MKIGKASKVDDIAPEMIKWLGEKGKNGYGLYSKEARQKQYQENGKIILYKNGS